MAVYAILTLAPQPRLSQLIATHYGERNMPWGDRTVFVRTPDSPQGIARKLDVKTRDQNGLTGSIEGVVITQLAPSYWGWTGSNLWEWMKAAHQEDAL